MQIKDVAAQAGVSIDTVRYYEKRGLLPEAPRTAAGYRLFDDASVERVRFIKQAQRLWFTLDEIASLLTIPGNSCCSRVREMLDHKLAEVDARLQAVGEFRDKLAAYLGKCDERLISDPASDDCPVIDEIAHGEID